MTQWLVQAIAWFVALAWLFKLVEAVRGLPKVHNLARPEFDKTPAGQPSLAVIVPARDEAAHIAACLESLIGQDYAKLHVIAVDDRSTDGTGAIMESLAREHPTRLEVIHVRELPAGWLGKTHALALAARHAQSKGETSGEGVPEYLLFTDADVVFHPEILRRSLAEAVASGADHFVTMPTTIVKSLGEGMILSFLQVVSLWAVRLWRVAKPGRRDAIGVGAFNLVRTSAYRRLGGFEATPMEILEDLRFGQRVKAARLEQRVATAPGMVTVHWAAGLFGIVNGMTKNLFAVFRFRSGMLLGAAGWFTVFCIAPVGLLAWRATRIPGAITLAAVAGLYALSGRTSRISGWYAALFPVSAVLFVYSMLRSMVITLVRGGVMWRGTFYSLAALRRETERPRMDTDQNG